MTVYGYDTAAAAEKAFNDFLANSKNGSKGETILSQTDKVGMASIVNLKDLRRAEPGTTVPTRSTSSTAPTTSRPPTGTPSASERSSTDATSSCSTRPPTSTFTSTSPCISPATSDPTT